MEISFPILFFNIFEVWSYFPLNSSDDLTVRHAGKAQGLRVKQELVQIYLHHFLALQFRGDKCNRCTICAIYLVPSWMK